MTKEDKFAELLSQGLTIKQVGDRMGYANPRAALHTIKRKLAAQGELEL
jgi:hypothetical protein